MRALGVFARILEGEAKSKCALSISYGDAGRTEYLSSRSELREVFSKDMLRKMVAESKVNDLWIYLGTNEQWHHFDLLSDVGSLMPKWQHFKVNKRELNIPLENQRPFSTVGNSQNSVFEYKDDASKKAFSIQYWINEESVLLD